MPEPTSAEKLHVLMLATDPRVLGGITNFTGTLMQYATQSQFTLMPIGSVKDQAGGGVRERTVARLRRLFTIPKQVATCAKTADVLHLNTPFNPKGLIRDGLILAALTSEERSKMLLYFHGWQEPTATVIALFPPFRRILCRLLRDVGCIMVLAPEFKAQLMVMGVDAARIIVTRTMFDGRDLKDAKPLGLHAKKLRRRVLFMSRFVREKGIDELLSSFTRIANDYPDVDFVMAGDGPEYRRIAELALALPAHLRRRIEFPGYVGGEQKAALLAGCSIFALPTYYPEGMPVALLEAMAAGKVLLTSDIGGIKQVVRDPENGVVLTSISEAAVEAGLRRLLDDPIYCEETGAKNAKYAWRTFEASVVTAEIEACYHALAGR